MTDVIQSGKSDAQRIADRMKPSNDTSTADTVFIVAMAQLVSFIPSTTVHLKNSTALPIRAAAISQVTNAPQQKENETWLKN